MADNLHAYYPWENFSRSHKLWRCVGWTNQDPRNKFSKGSESHLNNIWTTFSKWVSVVCFISPLPLVYLCIIFLKSNSQLGCSFLLKGFEIDFLKPPVFLKTTDPGPSCLGLSRWLLRMLGLCAKILSFSLNTLNGVECLFFNCINPYKSIL